MNRATTSNSNGIDFLTAGSANWYIGSSAVGINTDFQIYNYSANAVVLNIANTSGATTFSSTVGIGVTPSTILTINGGSGTYPTLGTATANALMVGRNDKAVGMFLGYAADGNGWIQQMRTDSATAYNLVLQPVGGNVGIGTDSPGQKFQVNGNVVFNGGTGASTFNDVNIGGIGGWSVGEAHRINFVYNTAQSPINFTTIESHFDGTNGRLRFRNIYNAGDSTTIAMTIEGNGNVLIGTTTDFGIKLYVNGYTKSTGYAFNAFSGGTEWQIGSDAVTGSGLYIYNTGGGYSMRLATSGAATFLNLGTGLVYSNGGTLTSTNPSDFNLKENIAPINYGLDEILKLNPVTFDWKNDKINQGKQYGFIAQEVQKIMPDLVKQGEYLGLDKEAIFTTLVKAIQQLKQEIDTLKN
jgi:hypothetical protein